jgi:hypothetical protein
MWLFAFKRQGVFRARVLDRQPYGLGAEQGKVHDKVAIAIGKDFAVCAEPAINAVWYSQPDFSLRVIIANGLLLCGCGSGSTRELLK